MTRTTKSSSNRRRLAVLSATSAAVAAAVTAGAALPVSGDPLAAAAAARPSGKLSPPAGAWLGAMVNPYRNTADSSWAEVTQLESAMRRKLAIVHHFYAYNELVSTTWEQYQIAQGRIPMLTWGAFDTKRLVDGSQDAFIRRQARAVKAIGDRVFLRFFHEMEGKYRIPVVHSAADYVRAWRYVHRIFREEGATNAVWVWCPTAWSFKPDAAPAASYYPGNDYVDWIAVDGYNWAPSQPGSAWRTFSQVFANFYKWARTKPKPLMIAELGVLEDPSRPERKAQWLQDALTAMRSDFPLFQAAVYFDTPVQKPGYLLDWRLRSSTVSLRTWGQIARSDYLSPTVPKLTAGRRVGPTERITNSSVEHDLTGWGQSLGPAAVARSRAVAQHHEVSVQVRNRGSATARVGFSDSPRFVDDTIDKSQYTASVWVYSPVAGRRITLNLRELRGSKTVITSKSVTAAFTEPGWKRLSTSLTAVRGGDQISYRVFSSQPAGGRFHADNLSLISTR